MTTFMGVSSAGTFIGLIQALLKSTSKVLNTKKKRKVVILLLAAIFLLFFMTLQNEDIDAIVDMRLNKIYSKYNLSVNDFGTWTGSPDNISNYRNVSEVKYSNDGKITRTSTKNDSAVREQVISGNIPKSIISFNYLTNRNMSMKTFPKFEPKPVSLNGKNIFALDPLGMKIPDTVEKVEKNEVHDGETEGKEVKDVKDPQENTKSSEENAKNKKAENIENPGEDPQSNHKTEDDKDDNANDSPIAKPINTETKPNQEAHKPDEEKPVGKNARPKKAGKKSLRDKFNIRGGGGGRGRIRGREKETVTDKQGRELKRDLYNLAPEIFDFIPREFENEVKSHCWIDDEEGTWCLPYFYIIGMPNSGSENLFQKIAHHPAVTNTTKMAHHWWSRGRARNKGNLLKSFQGYIRAGKGVIEAFQKQDFGMVYGDDSTSLFWDNARWWNAYYPGYKEAPPYTTADILGAIQPEAKLLITLTEPSVTVYENYLITNWKTASPEDFDERCTNSIDIFEECLQTKSSRTCIYKPFDPNEKTMRLQWGFLSQYFEDWLKAFSLKQFYVVERNKLEKSCLIELPRIYSFLGLERLSMRRIREICQTESKVFRAPPPNSAPIKDATKELLDAYYEPYFDKLEEVLKKH